MALDESIIEFDNEEKFFKAFIILRERFFKNQIQFLKISNDPDKFMKIMEIEKNIQKLKSKK